MKRYTVLTVLLVCVGWAVETEVNPWDFVSGRGRFGALVRIDSTEEVGTELLAAGAVVEVSAPLEGKAVLFGAHVRMLADVGGDLMAAGAVVEVAGDIEGQSQIAGAAVYLDGTFSDSLEVGGAVIIVRGHLKGPVMLSAAEIYIEDGAVIEDTLRYSAAQLHTSESAVLASGTKEVIPEPEEEESAAPPVQRTFGGWLVGTVLSFLFFAGAGVFLSLAMPRHLMDVTGRILVNPGLSALTGGIAFLGAPVVVLLILLLLGTVVGIGAGMFIAGLYLVGFVFSILYAGTAMGRWMLSLLKRKGKKVREPHIILSMLLGVFVAVLVCRTPFVKWFARLGSFVFGFGAVLISLWLAVKPRPAGGA